MKSVKILTFFSFFLLAEIGCTVSDPEMMELIQEIKAQNDKLLAELEKMKAQLDALDGKYQVILGSLADNKKELEALKAQIDALKGQIAQQLIKIDQLSTQLTQQGADIIKLSAEIAELKASCDELKALIEELLANKSPIPTNGLIAWYPFNGNASDESGNGNNGNVQGAILTKDRSSNNASAYIFDGKNSQIAVNNFQELKSWSISLWFNTNNEVIFSGPQYLLTLGSKNYSGNGEPGFGVNGNSNTTCPSVKLNEFFIFDGKSGCSDIVYGKNYLRNTWYNIVLTRENDVYSIFSDGIFLNSGKLLEISVDKLTIGKRLNFYYSGVIDDIGLWNRALTPSEISKIYKGTKF